MPVPPAQRLTILHEDTDIVAIDKPPGLAAIPGRGDDDSVLQRLSAQFDQRMFVVHRLDKDTSGVMLFARHTAAQRHLSHQFQNNTVQKEYLALVAGRPQQNEGEIEGPIGPHPATQKRMAVLKHGGRPARTLWKVEQSFRDFTLLRVFPKTGKTHQIRVHLAHIGLPLAIDPIYGHGREAILLSQIKKNYRAKRGEEERPLISRLTLHAHRLQFVHPDDQPRLIESPPPKDFRVVLKQLSQLGR